ncbi:MAG: TIGR00296 family protein [Thermoplasmata archaeon]
MVTHPEGEFAVRWARTAITRHLAANGDSVASPTVRPREDVPPLFDEKRGVFVTLSGARSGRLRGCIGFPLPHFPLAEGLARAAVAAATEDPRFPPVTSAEMDDLVVEVSVLSIPLPVSAEAADDRPRAIRIGWDGLLVEADGTSGILLPQVAVEWGWDARAFLDAACEKAGLPARAWREPSTRVLTFTAEIFHETSPGGEVGRVDLATGEGSGARDARRR